MLTRRPYSRLNFIRINPFETYRQGKSSQTRLSFLLFLATVSINPSCAGPSRRPPIPEPQATSWVRSTKCLRQTHWSGSYDSRATSRTGRDLLFPFAIQVASIFVTPQGPWQPLYLLWPQRGNVERPHSLAFAHSGHLLLRLTALREQYL